METRRRSKLYTPAKPSPLINETFTSSYEFGFQQEEESFRSDQDNVFLSSKKSSSSVSAGLKSNAQALNTNAQDNLMDFVSNPKVPGFQTSFYNVLSPFKQGIEQFLQSPGPQAIHNKLKARQTHGSTGNAQISQLKNIQKLNKGTRSPSAGRRQSTKAVEASYKPWKDQFKDGISNFRQVLINYYHYSQLFLRQYWKIIFQIAFLSTAILSTLFVAKFLVDIINQDSLSSSLNEPGANEQVPFNSQNEQQAFIEEILMSEPEITSQTEESDSQTDQESNSDVEVFQQSQHHQIEYLTDVVSKLVDQKLNEFQDKFYIKVQKEYADYALESGGARIVKELTSKTFINQQLVNDYELSRTKWSQIRKLFGWSKIDVAQVRDKISKWLDFHGPQNAIQSQVDPGKCWYMKMNNGKGQITVELAKPIVPTVFGLEHVLKQVALKNDVSDAPQKLQVYALFHDEKNLGSMQRSAVQIGEIILSKNALETEYSRDESQPLKFTDSQSTRTFFSDSKISAQVLDRIKQLGGLKFVQFRVSENFGNNDYTCIYRIRVQGE